MQELTTHQMSEMDGGIGFRNRFFSGFVCGASIAAALAITPTLSVVARLGIYTTLIGSCGHAFFV